MDLCVSNQNSFGELIKNGDLSIGANKRSDECSERFDSSDQCSESKKIQSFIEDKKVDYSKMQRFCYSYERKSGMLDYCWEPGPKVLILRFLFFTKIFFFENWQKIVSLSEEICYSLFTVPFYSCSFLIKIRFSRTAY